MAGAGFQAAGVSRTASRTLVVSNVPSNAQVVGAYLYWASFGDGSQGSFNGNSITGAVLGVSSMACSTLGSVTVYRADAASLVPTNGNGSFLVQLPDSGSASVTPSTLGASLVVIYQRDDLPAKSISLYDGASVLDATNKTFFLNLQNFGQVPAGVPSARLTHIVGNGTAALYAIRGSPRSSPSQARASRPSTTFSAWLPAGASSTTSKPRVPRRTRSTRRRPRSSRSWCWRKSANISWRSG